MHCGHIDRAAVAQLRDDLARASTEILSHLEGWLTELDEENW